MELFPSWTALSTVTVLHNGWATKMTGLGRGNLRGGFLLCHRPRLWMWELMELFWAWISLSITWGPPTDHPTSHNPWLHLVHELQLYLWRKKHSILHKTWILQAMYQVMVIQEFMSNIVMWGMVRFMCVRVVGYIQQYTHHPSPPTHFPRCWQWITLSLFLRVLWMHVFKCSRPSN